MQMITIKPNKAFVWPKGLRLIPSENVTIEFPGGLVAENQKIGAVIEVSDDAEIGFQKSNDPENRFSRIILKVEKGDGILINRSTQAMLVESEQPVTFQRED